MLSIFLTALLSSSVRAHPAHEVPRSGLQKRIVDLDSFRVALLTDYVNATEASANTTISSITKRDSYVDTATELVKKTVPGVEFRLVQDHYVGQGGIAHVNFKQTAHGLDIDNADFNVNIDKDGSIYSYGNSFYTGEIPAESPLTKRDFSDPVQALVGAVNVIQLPVDASAADAKPADGTETYTLTGTTGATKDPEARLVYFQKEDGTLALTWRVETDIYTNWLLSYVDANTNTKVHGVVDWSADATYQVFPWGVNDPTEGSRVVLTDPWDLKASEFTWHGVGTTSYPTTTRGNNAIAQSNPSGGSAYLNNYRPVSSTSKFEYAYSNTTGAPSTYADASISQLFYTANTYHDVLYELGFTEAAGNFETNNNGAGGLGNDAVILNAMDGAGVNNADFSTPPDGQPGRMRMFIWTTATPNRDGVFEAGVIIHEYTHGLSNRLTGGPANSNCLNALESGGMGEGWGDFMATAIRLKPADTRAKNYPLGAWVDNDTRGIRAYPYSTSLTTNPLIYTSVDGMTGVHAIGTVWANMLYEVMWNLIDKHGKSHAVLPAFDANGVPTDGKFLAMKLVVDGMALQPCSPNFVQARDAILDADRTLTGGANACELWTAFAKRGLGSGARYSSSRRTGSTAIPTGVC